MRWMWVLVLGFSLACAYVCVHYDNLNAEVYLRTHNEDPVYETIAMGCFYAALGLSVIGVATAVYHFTSKKHLRGGWNATRDGSRYWSGKA